jgi:hypothetical protein
MRRHLGYLLVFIVYSFVPTALIIAAEDAIGVKEEDRTDNILFWLERAGDKLGYHFTLEQVACDYETKQPLYTARLPRAPLPSSGEEMVLTLKEKLPGLAVLPSPHQERVIHLVDESLMRRERYPMMQRVTLKYQGRLYGLLERLTEYDARFSIGFARTPAETFNDHSTRTTIDVKEMMIRDVLTAAVPLKQYKRIIWIAREMPDENGDYTMGVQYTGIDRRPANER